MAVKEKIKSAVRNINVLALLIGVLALVVYLTTIHLTFGGYEEETARGAMSLLVGKYPLARAGVSSVILYFPFILFFKLIRLNSVTALTVVPVFYSALTIVCTFYCAWYLTHKKSISIAISIIIALGTAIWPYANIGMEYQAAFYITLLLALLLRAKEKNTSLLMPSLAFALLATAKAYGPMLGLPFVAFIILSHPQNASKKDLIKKIALAVLPSVLLFFGTMIWQFFARNSLTNGYNLAHDFQIWTWWEGFYGVFFSAGKSIFLFSPLLIVALFTWKKFYAEHRAPAVYILLTFLLLFFITAPFSYWSDETWTVRKLVPILGLMHLPLIYVLDKPWRRQIFSASIAAVLMIFSLYVQILGASYDYGKQLIILRQANLDSLSKMEFTPTLSHVPLFHTLLTGYIFNKNQELKYREDSWFRWTAHQKEVAFNNVKISLTPYQQPDIAWLKNNLPFNGRSAFWFLLGADVLLLIITTKIFFYFRKREI